MLKEPDDMNKSLAILFAATSMAWLTAAAISIEYNGWLAALFFALGIVNIGCGFAVKARQSRRART